MDRTTVIQKFESLNLWRKDGARAPHKPLLVLYAIGELLRGKSHLLPYSEIDDNLGSLLSEFGPRRSRQGTQYPFWRLQSDGIWEVTDADKIRLTASGDAFKRDLVDYDVRGGFTEEVAKQLQADSKLASEIIQKMLDGHFPDTWHEDILQGVGIELTSKGTIRQKRDPNFRPSILKAYEYRCAVCGFDVRLGRNPVALEAAHIKWRQARRPRFRGKRTCSLFPSPQAIRPRRLHPVQRSGNPGIRRRPRHCGLSGMADALPRPEAQLPAAADLLPQRKLHTLARQRGVSRGVP